MKLQFDIEYIVCFRNPFVVPPLGGSFKPVVPIQAWLRLVIQFMLGIGNAHIYHQDMSRDARYEVN